MDQPTQEYLPAQVVNVHGKLDPFQRAQAYTYHGDGHTILEIVWDVIGQRQTANKIVVLAQGRPVPDRLWHVVRPAVGTSLEVHVLPRNAETGRLAAMIAVSAFVGPYVSGLVGGGFWGAVAGGAASAVAMLAVNALIPIQQPKFEEDTTSPVLSIGAARNELRPFAPIPQILGKYRYTPPYAAKPYTQVEGADQYAVMLFTLGYGPLDVDRLSARLGDTPLTSYSDYEMEIKAGWLDDDPITLYEGTADPVAVNRRILYGDCPDCPGDPPPDPGAPLKYDEAVTNADKAEVVVTLPNGLIQIKDQGDRVARAVDLRISYALTSSPTFEADMTANETSRIVSAKTTNTLRESFTLNFPNIDNWTVRVYRATVDDPEGVDEENDNHIYSATWWTTLTSFNTTENPISGADDQCITLIALRIKATDQLQGFVENFSIVAQTVCLDWDGTPGDWSLKPTSNPASLFRLTLQGPANQVPVADNRIDITQLENFWGWCNIIGATFNMVRDFTATVYECLQNIAASGIGRTVQNNGNWAVIYDDVNLYTTPVQQFTPRNSWNMTGNKQFVDFPHAMRVRFVDEDNEYSQQEITVYNVDERQGTLYDETTATRFESIEFNGLTTASLNTRMAQYQMGVALWRQNVLTFNADIEHIICLEGDPISIQEDYLGIGVGTARVVGLNGSDVTLDSEFDVSGVASPGMHHRAADQTFPAVAVTPQGDLTKCTTYTHPGPLPAIGDLASVGDVVTTTRVFVVDSIIPSNIKSAQIRCYPAYFEYPQ